MRLVAVNHLHPATPHVGGLRVARFARALAGRGHQVVLLTGPLADEAPTTPAALAAALAGHDWHRPLHVVCPPRPRRLLDAARDPRLPRPLRRAVLAWHYLRHGGVFTDWTDGSRALWPVLARSFRPQVTWGTFGNTDAWNIARGIARASACPWVMDIKDVWEQFIPAAVSGPVARRFSDAAACTTISRNHLEGSASRFSCPKTVIYSGFSSPLPEGAGMDMPFRITVTGSTYGQMAMVTAGLGRFLETLAPAEAKGVVFTYAGADHQLATRMTARAGLGCGLDIRPYVPLESLALLQREAFINVYGRADDRPEVFHHKIFELLSADRPIACCPREYGEAPEIMLRAGADFTACPDATALAAALDRAWRARSPQGTGIDRGLLARHDWDSQAERLEAVLDAARAQG